MVRRRGRSLPDWLLDDEAKRPANFRKRKGGHSESPRPVRRFARTAGRRGG
jgi:hypothetical protein